MKKKRKKHKGCRNNGQNHYFYTLYAFFFFSSFLSFFNFPFFIFFFFFFCSSYFLKIVKTKKTQKVHHIFLKEATERKKTNYYTHTFLFNKHFGKTTENLKIVIISVIHIPCHLLNSIFNSTQLFLNELLMSIKEKENANHFHQTTPLNDFRKFI